MPCSLLNFPDEILLQILSYMTHAAPPHQCPDPKHTIQFYHTTVARLSASKKLRSLAIDSYYHDRTFHFDLSIAEVNFRKIGMRVTRRVFISERGTFGDAEELYGGVLGATVSLELDWHYERGHVEMLMARVEQILGWCTKLRRVTFAVNVQGFEQDGTDETPLQVIEGFKGEIKQELDKIIRCRSEQGSDILLVWEP